MIIPVDRPEQVGLKRVLAITSEHSMKMSWTMAGEVAQEENDEWKAEIECQVTTDAVDPKGKPTAVTIDLRKIEIAGNKAARPLPPGTVVKGVRENGKAVFTVAGEPVEERVQQILEYSFSLTPQGKGDENVAFGVDQPRKPGEEWQVNPAELVATLPADMPFTIKPDSCKGAMRFVELAGEGEEQLATLQGEVELEIGALKDMPPGFKIEKASMRVTLDGQFPVAKDKQSVREGMGMIMDFSGSIQGPDGNEAKLSISARAILKKRELP